MLWFVTYYIFMPIKKFLKFESYTVHLQFTSNVESQNREKEQWRQIMKG